MKNRPEEIGARGRGSLPPFTLNPEGSVPLDHTTMMAHEQATDCVVTAVMRSGFEEGSYLRLVEFCVTHL